MFGAKPSTCSARLRIRDQFSSPGFLVYLVKEMLYASPNRRWRLWGNSNTAATDMSTTGKARRSRMGILRGVAASGVKSVALKGKPFRHGERRTPASWTPTMLRNVDNRPKNAGSPIAETAWARVVQWFPCLCSHNLNLRNLTIEVQSRQSSRNRSVAGCRRRPYSPKTDIVGVSYSRCGATSCIALRDVVMCASLRTAIAEVDPTSLRPCSRHRLP